MFAAINYKENRKKYFTNTNYRFNLNKRLKWIKKFIDKNTKVIEIGSGSGLIKKIINSKIITTDIKKNPYIDYILDMNAIVIPKKFINYFKIIIFNHSLHHSKSN